MKTSIILLLGAVIALKSFSQSATLDLRFDAFFETDTIFSVNGFKKPHALRLSKLDKENYYKHFIKYIKDTGDYSGVLWGAEKGCLENYNPKRFIDESKNKRSPFYDIKTPYLYKDGKIIEVKIIERYDRHEDDSIVYEDGDYEYRYDKRDVLNDFSSIGFYEDWKIDKKGFHKYVRAMSNLMYAYDDEWNYKPLYKQAFDKALKTKLKINKKSIFKKDVAYDYLFFPNYDSLMKSNKCLKDEGKPEENYFKAIDEELTGVSKNEADVFVNNLFIALTNGDAKMLDENGSPFENPLNELYREQTIEVFDENTGEAKLDKDGNVMYINDRRFYNYQDIVGFHFLEDWYFAKNTYGIIKKVKAIQLLIANYDDYGNKAGYLKSPYKIVF